MAHLVEVTHFRQGPSTLTMEVWSSCTREDWDRVKRFWRKYDPAKHKSQAIVTKSSSTGLRTARKFCPICGPKLGGCTLHNKTKSDSAPWRCAVCGTAR